MNLPQGLLVGTALALALAWGLFALNPHAWPGISGTITQSGLYGANLVVTARSRRVKVVIVRHVQRWLVNPIVRALLAVGINPLGLAILETRGRSSGLPRRTPVGNGRRGDDFWLIAEHGKRANYVRNLRRDPHVRVRLRTGWHYRWLDGVAEVLPADDALARQRSIIRWHPLRVLNAMNVRVLGADLLTVHIRLIGPSAGEHIGRADRAVSHVSQLLPAGKGAMR